MSIHLLLFKLLALITVPALFFIFFVIDCCLQRSQTTNSNLANVESGPSGDN